MTANYGSVQVKGGNIVAGNRIIGYVFDNDGTSDGTYRVVGRNIYRNGNKVGYACGTEEFRINDGTLWKLSR